MNAKRTHYYYDSLVMLMRQQYDDIEIRIFLANLQQAPIPVYYLHWDTQKTFKEKFTTAVEHWKEQTHKCNTPSLRWYMSMTEGYYCWFSNDK